MVDQTFVKNQISGLHDRLEASLDRRLKKLADSPHSLKRTAWLVAGIIVGWDVIKWAAKAVLTGVWNVIL